VRREFGPLNARRLPAYHRLDVRVTRAFEVRGSRLELFADLFNAYDRANVRGYAYNLHRDGSRWTTTRDVGEELLPILPTVGFRWVFSGS
jgi:hypothetical protein